MTENRTLVLIPARMAATRLPGKPLMDIAGLPMIVHVVRRAVAARIGRVAVATDTPESSEPGVVDTSRQAVPSNAQVCVQDLTGQTATATVTDPAAPKVTVSVPDGWSVAPGSGDVGARFTGPDDMLAEISITATALDPAAAFTRYSDDVMAKYPISTLSLLPADLCGYSGQKLMGTWADDPEESTEYQDRVTHIWTNSKNYLVAIHVEAPSGTAGFDAAASTLTSDFNILLP